MLKNKPGGDDDEDGTLFGGHMEVHKSSLLLIERDEQLFLSSSTNLFLYAEAKAFSRSHEEDVILYYYFFSFIMPVVVEGFSSCNEYNKQPYSLECTGKHNKWRERSTFLLDTNKTYC